MQNVVKWPVHRQFSMYKEVSVYGILPEFVQFSLKRKFQYSWEDVLKLPVQIMHQYYVQVLEWDPSKTCVRYLNISLNSV